MVSNLHIVNASENLISEIKDETFIRLVNINHIYLRSNKITKISAKAFIRLTYLVTLFLDDNQLTHLEVRTFEANQDLKYLHLQNNLLTRLENKIFTYNKNLQELLLDDNRINAIGPDVFQNIRNVKGNRISLSGNRCDQNKYENVDQATEFSKKCVENYEANIKTEPSPTMTSSSNVEIIAGSGLRNNFSEKLDKIKSPSDQEDENSTTIVGHQSATSLISAFVFVICMLFIVIIIVNKKVLTKVNTNNNNEFSATSEALEPLKGVSNQVQERSENHYVCANFDAVGCGNETIQLNPLNNSETLESEESHYLTMDRNCIKYKNEQEASKSAQF